MFATETYTGISQEFDYIVVGGGSSGCVVAARLTEHPDAKVLVIEAGLDPALDSVAVPTMWPTLFGTEVDWGYVTAPQEGLDGAVLNYPRGKVLGGSSSTNAMAHIRGHPNGFDVWVDDGAPGWGYRDLLPYFRRSETVRGRDPGLRGTTGPMKIEPIADRHPIAKTFVGACRSRGYPLSDDLNGPHSEGVCWYDRNIVSGRRQSAADAYLRPALHRKNLTVLAGATVTRLIFERTRCTGVVFRRADEQPTAVHAQREVILAAGAIGSPHLLQLSGIGPADLLAEHGIDVVADMPGVGENLSDHPLGVIVYSATRQLHSSSNNHFDALAAVRINSESGGPDAHILIADLPLPPPGYSAPENGFTIEFSMLGPHSRGSVKLASADPAAAPLIDPGFLTDERDVRFSLRALRATREIGRSSEFEQWGAAEHIPGADVTSDGELISYLRRSVGTYYHAVGTCRMGAGMDAVTDTELRVKAVDGLRVVDASVMPSLPAANTNATVLAIAEKGAELIASGWREPVLRE